MKNYFNNLLNSSVFRYMQRLAVLCAFLSISAIVAADSTEKYAKLIAYVHPKSTGEGCVYITESNSSSDEACTTNEPSERSVSASNTGDTYEFTFTLTAESEPGSYVAGWTKSSTSIETLEGSTSHTVKLNGTTEKGANIVSETWYAVFKPIVALPEPNKVSIKVIGGESSPTMVKLPEVVNTTKLTLSITGDSEQNEWFQLSKDDNTYASSLSFASSASELSTNGRVTDLPFYVKFVGTMENATNYAKNVVVRITAPTEAPDMYWDIPVEVTSEYDTYQFLRPQIVGVSNYTGIDFGNYTATLADPDETQLTITDANSKPIKLTTTGHYSVTLEATPSSSYKFYGWYKITFNEDGTEKAPILISQSSTYGPVDFNESAKIYPVYLQNEHALFRIKEDATGKLYYDLQEALDIAAADKSTVVFNAPTKRTTGTLYPKADGTAYTIPAGVTLLVPGDAAYTCRTKYSDDLPDSDFPSADASAFYSKLKLSNGTKITLQGGNLCVYSTISSKMAHNGRPISYGWIEMGENCEIATTASQQSYLYVLGYITGPSSLSSSVQLNEGSIAYEAFQMPDFRGGKALMPTLGLGVANNKKGVFPSEQFYIQSIEVPMAIQSGATLKAMMPADITLRGIVKGELDIIAKNSGLIQLTDNVELVKSYDAQRDVQVYQVIGKGATQSSAKIGNVFVNISGISMNTEDFVLPITSNMEIVLDGVTMSSDNRVGMLAGSKIWIKENAILNQNAQLYVYDKDQNKLLPNPSGYSGDGYFGSENKELEIVKHTPNNSQKVGSNNKRTVANLTSAQLRVDGQLNIAGNGLYTTESGADIVSFVDGATIKVNSSFKNAAQSEELYRLKQKSNEAVEYLTLQVNPAWLKNSDGTYLKTTGDAVEYKFYVTGQDADENPVGIWSLPPATVDDESWQGTRVTATMPTNPVDMTIQCNVSNVSSDSYAEAFTATLSNTTDFAFADNKFSYDANKSILSIHVIYTPRDNTETDAISSLTLVNTTIPTAEYTYTTTLTATEEYVPNFTLDKSDIQLPSVPLGQTATVNNAFTITPASDNVAGMQDSRLKWTYSLSDSDFGYTQGNNTITFTSSTPGTKYATLTIKATYTPTTGTAKEYSQTINLTGTTQTVNTLQFSMADQIWVTDKNLPVQFAGQNNTSAITVTLTNADNSTPAAELNASGGTYTINALKAGTFTLTATQSASGNYAGTVITKTITVAKLTPSPVWNWGVVYGNQSYTLPFDPTTVEDGYWTLHKQEDAANAISYDSVTHIANIMNVGAQTYATFEFYQKETDTYVEFSQEYTAQVCVDPRVLPTTIDNNAKYNILVGESHSSGVVCDEAGGITLPSNDWIILQFIGIPDELSFQITGPGEHASIIVAENTDANNETTWNTITLNADKWKFNNMGSNCVKLTNNSANPITLTNLTITESSSYMRDTYYASAGAVVYPSGAGTVAAKGSYSSTNLTHEDVFVSLSPFSESATAYSLSHVGYVELSNSLNLFFQAQSNPGYYFSEWVTIDGFIPTTSVGDPYNNYEVRLTTTAKDKSLAYPFDTYINLYCQQNEEVCTAAKPNNGDEPNPIAVDMMNAGALVLIPATHMGTWQANFALAEVVSTENVTYDEVTSPKPADLATAEVVFNVRGDDTDDFVPTLDEYKGFSFKEGDIALSTTHNTTYAVNVTYTPQDIHGTHTANFTLARATVEGQTASTKTAKLTVFENLTPSFTLDNTNFGAGTLGQETIIDILPANKNTVAQLLDPAKLHWTASMSAGASFEILSVADDGTCKVRYFRTTPGNQFATLTLTATYTDSKGVQVPYSTTCDLSGSATNDKALNTLALKQNIVMYVDDDPVSPFSVNDPNNTAPITINLPAGCTALVKEDGMLKPSGDCTTGTYTITASQAENNYFQASTTLTTTVTVKKHTPEVTWNLNQLYFGQTYDAPITTNSDGALNITASGVGASIVDFDASARTINVAPWTEGEYNVTFTVSLAESNYYEAFTNTYSAIIYKDPRHLRVDVNSDAVYQAVTDASKTGANVSYSSGAIHFADIAGSEYSSRQWTMFFIGVPDQLVFTPTGNNAWQIQESPNGSSWNPTYASAQIPAGTQFSMSLRPNTRYIRVSYASNADAPSNGALSNMYITPLEGVKSNVDGMYLAIAADPVNHPTTKNLLLQYTASDDLTVYTSDPQFLVSVTSLPAVASGEYGEQTIVVTSKATIEKEGRLFVKNKSDEILLELPIQSFVYPQKLPVQLATDNAQRFHYLATETNYVKWDMDTRTIIMQNAPANSDRSFTFAFEGAPSIIRFNHTAIAGRGTWTIRESADNAYWYDTDPTTRVVNGNELEQGLLNTTRYVNVKYTSPYSEAVNINELIIVGNASVTTDVTKLEFTDQVPTQLLTVTAINLADFDVMIDNANFTASLDKSSLTATGIVEVPVTITWSATAAIDNAVLTIVNPNDGNAVLATVELMGSKSAINDPANTGIYTGIAPEITKLNGSFEGYKRRPVDLTNAYDAATGTKALFDYLYVYGETSTMDGSSVITTPTTQRGSNAKTPCYIYQRVGDTYQLVKVVENVNSSDKAISGAITVPVQQPGVSTRIYITGFAPYASTGYTKEEEGVWLFRGEAGSKLDIYLEDCYIYSRYKTIDGHSFLNRNNGESFAESYARGSGGVLVFECSSLNNKTNPFDVTIHTCDSSLLKSHYGCFMASIVGRAYQVSSPVQIHLMSSDITTTTHLSFDDIWPTAITRTTTAGVVTEETLTTTRTNGFLSLQKQVNNAPSIDLGSPNTVVNFNGGQVELQNAQNVSDNYKTTLAISFRGGKFATFFLAYGVGSDEVSGTVNFNDGTTTVKPMTVDAKYRQYYLMDTDEHGNQLTTTSCLRCPKNTYIYGGSHSMMRACGDPTSQGGAPLNRPDGKPLGLYKFPKYPEDGKKGGWTDGVNGLVNIVTADIDPYNYQVPIGYNVASVTPNTNGTDTDADDYLNFWFDPSFEPSAQPEVDKTISYWKTCMTEIAAEYAGYGGSAGGDVTVAFSGDNQTELVVNLLYCKLDQNILDEINRDGYKAPVKSPSAELGAYLEIPPSSVGDDVQHFVNSTKSYRVEKRVYYITTATADVWNAFTAPFDVQNIYIAETYPEEELEKIAAQQLKQGNNARKHILQLQAKHNANFAAFFAVTVALGKEKTFNEIYSEYLDWAKLQDQSTGLYTSGTYDLRGIHKLDPYMPGNWDANCYIYENNGNWVIDPTDEEKFTTQWIAVDTTDHKIMEKGKTYSMLLPYCTKCEPSLSDRNYWDYWSGKFLIFESTDTPEGGHIIDGTSALNIDNLDPYELGLQEGEAVIKGNTTLANVSTTNELLYTFTADMQHSTFMPIDFAYDDDENLIPAQLLPTESFLVLDYVAPMGMYIKGVRHTGQLIFGTRDNTTTGNGNMPTISGNSDMLVTATTTGINIAVATPQFVRVYTTNGSVIYAGMVNDNINIPLNSTGIYMVAGENTVQKIMLNR